MCSNYRKTAHPGVTNCNLKLKLKSFFLLHYIVRTIQVVIIQHIQENLSPKRVQFEKQNPDVVYDLEQGWSNLYVLRKIKYAMTCVNGIHVLMSKMRLVHPYILLPA